VALEPLKLRKTNQSFHESISKYNRKDLGELGELQLFVAAATGAVLSEVGSPEKILTLPTYMTPMTHIEVYVYRSTLLLVTAAQEPADREGLISKEGRLPLFRAVPNNRHGRNLKSKINLLDVINVQSEGMCNHPALAAMASAHPLICWSIDDNAIIFLWREGGVSMMTERLWFELPDATTRDRWVTSLRGKMALKPPRFARSHHRAVIIGMNSFDQAGIKLRVSFIHIIPRVSSGGENAHASHMWAV